MIDRHGDIVAISRGEIDQAFLNHAIALAESTHERRVPLRLHAAAVAICSRRGPRSTASLAATPATRRPSAATSGPR